MLCNTMSHYPDGVDEMTFFQDNDLERIEIINLYNNLISKGKYNEANKFISQQENIYGYFADFFNAIESRIYSLQEHLLHKPPKKSFFVYTDSTENEPEISDNTIWIQQRPEGAITLSD